MKCHHTYLSFICGQLFVKYHSLELSKSTHSKRPIIEFELHKKEFNELELQKNEPSKIALHKFEPIVK